MQAALHCIILEVKFVIVSSQAVQMARKTCITVQDNTKTITMNIMITLSIPN